MTRQATGAAPRILVLEDDWLVAEAVGLTVHKLGNRVVGPAHTVEEALELVES